MRHACIVTFAILIQSTFAVGLASGEDWPQWLGKNRDGRWNESGVMTSFPEGGPKVLWRQPVSLGYSGPAVVGNHVYVADFEVSEGTVTNNPGKRDVIKGKERLLCLDAKTGKTIWTYADEVVYQLSYPGGPRATPTVDGDFVFFLGAEGHLRCLNRKDGSLVWSKDFKKAYGLKEAPIWGFAAHPLVVGETVFCLAGGEGSVAVAFDRKTGKEKWKALSSPDQGYCPPTMIRAGGTDQLLIWHSTALNSLNPETGEVYWTFELTPAYKMSIIAPIKSGDYLLTTALQGTSLLLKLDQDAPKATEVWRNMGIHPDHNPPLVDDGHIYGVDVKGHLRCIDLMTGKRKWESLATCPNGRPAGSATGFLVKNNDHYYIATETGDLLIAQLSPEGYKEKGRFHMLDTSSRSFGRQVVWSHPAFANKCVFARNDNEIVCISLAK